jgi:23S rRNA (pseudouridine1915-N3)-methyltransferase
VRIRVVFVGRPARDPLLDAAADYLVRAGRRFDAGLVPLSARRRRQSDDDDHARAAEADALLRESSACRRVALDAGGRAFASSAEWARALEDFIARGQPVAFLVGGATGLDERVRREADATWALSPLTLPHRLAVLVLCEQIYRAAEIGRNGPYAK